MGLNVSRTTEPLQFNTGIGKADFADLFESPVVGHGQKQLLPGSTTVSQATDALFPTGRGVEDQIMRSLVAGNTSALRTPGGFDAAARSALATLRAEDTAAAAAAAAEIEQLLEDTDLFEHYRMGLLET